MATEQTTPRTPEYYRSSEYYRKRYLDNKEYNMARQNDYHKRMKRHDELLEFLDPESFTLKREAYLAYQAAYRAKNQPRIIAHRKRIKAEKLAAKEAAKTAENQAEKQPQNEQNRPQSSHPNVPKNGSGNGKNDAG